MLNTGKSKYQKIKTISKKQSIYSKLTIIRIKNLVYKILSIVQMYNHSSRDIEINHKKKS